MSQSAALSNVLEFNSTEVVAPVKAPRVRRPKAVATVAVEVEAPVVEKKPRLSSAATDRRYRRQFWSAVALTIPFFALLSISCPHIALGQSDLLGRPVYEGWAFAVVIELGYVAFEFAGVCCATPTISTEFDKVARIYSPVVLTISGVMNAWFFYSSAPTLPGKIAGIAFGLAIPFMMYLTTTALKNLFLTCDR